MSFEGTRRAFNLLKSLPRVSLENLKPNFKRKKLQIRGKYARHNRVDFKRFQAVPIGYEGGTFPFHLRFKAQTWNKEVRVKLSYFPLPLGKLQLLIDLERLRTDIPIDICQLSNSGVLGSLNLHFNEGGYLLQDKGMDLFKAQINLEVQWTTEQVIAAVERTGSTITTAYYDPLSLEIVKNPLGFFQRGVPIKKRMLPPQNLIEYYSDPKNRGYLADPDAIAEERLVLAQKYGYELPDIKKSPKYEMLIQRKDPRQIFYGLQPGWIVSLKDKTILKPKDEELLKYYTS